MAAVLGIMRGRRALPTPMRAPRHRPARPARCPRTRGPLAGEKIFFFSKKKFWFVAVS